MRGFPLVLGAAAVATLAVALPFVLGAGSAVQVDTGPLGGGPVNGLECGPGPTVVIGIDELRNSTGSPIRVEKFILVDPRGVKLMGVDLVPLPAGDGPDMGFGSPYAPSLLSTLPGWDGRRALPMTMAPGPTRWDPVFGLRLTAKTGTLSYPELLYEYRGVQYLWTSQTSVQVVQGPGSSAIRECAHLR